MANRFLSKEDIEEIKKYATLKQVLNFNFSTNMLFRCTVKKYAEDFKSGKIRFNQPKYWIEAERQGNKGLGDELEGIFLITSKDDTSKFITQLKNDSNYDHFIKNNKLFFRKKSIQELYCFCLYGLNDNSYTRKSIDRFGNIHYTACIDKSYFSSFSNIKSKEEYLLKGDSNDKPVVIFIHNPRLFFQKIRNFFLNLGIREKDIIISPVEYLDYEKNSYSSIPYPQELLLKDKFYSNQSEIRIIINSTNSDYIKYMNEHNNIIDVGDISDIVDIYDYYFDDMLLEKRGNTLLFTLPFPIQERIEDMTLRKMLNIFIQIYKDDLPYEITFEERKKELDFIKDTIYKKYKITLVVRDDKIYFPDLYEDLENILDK